MPEEEVDLSAATVQSLDKQASPKSAKVVHLPSEEVQEEQLRQRADDERRKQSDAESSARSSQRLNAPQTELASSPSSTVGAYSAATPLPPQDSPETSPDSETAQVDVLPPKDLRLSPEQQREKDEHDRILEAQKEIARSNALGDVAATPDEQLRWEEKEAAARQLEEQSAREDVGGPEPDSKTARTSTEAEQVAEAMEVDPRSQQMREASVPAADEAQPNDPATSKVQVGQDDAQPDDDTIAVAHRIRSPPEPSVEAARHPEAGASMDRATNSSPGSRPERMTTRVSSGAMRQKSVSEILGQSQSPPNEGLQSARRELLSPEPVSPLTQRRQSNDHANHATNSSPQFTRPSFPRLSLPMRTTTDTRPSLDRLDALKGASQDPERDYLEPLFRIQAHESANSTTRTLPDLIKMVPKALSTEDHFTALHERLDFRMLRRIYQLQNANKWSLRQMEKCQEPKQPMTHHDHIVAEMKWMRKDFKAERKMKKSICAWLARRCADFVASGPEERKALRINVKSHQAKPSPTSNDAVPELELAGDSAPEDDLTPSTPRAVSPLPATLVVAPEIASKIEELHKSGKLAKTLEQLPKVGLLSAQSRHQAEPVTLVSKFVTGKVIPNVSRPARKRSRYDYDDEAEVVESRPDQKRRRHDEHESRADGSICALFDPENKPVRDRLHSNNVFRPPSEFMMPSTQFYEFRSGSQWIWEDDQKLRKSAKDYSFNWSLIADEMQLSTRYKSSAERRTPWECFERWVELESLPADMRKTVYFKTWFQRLEQSQQAAERRYQQQVAHIQQQAAQSGGPTHVPPRRRTAPTRVEKRRSTRYLWMVEGFRKLAKKREQAAWKQAESTFAPCYDDIPICALANTPLAAARAAAQRKSQSEPAQVNKMVKMTPQEFSKKRQERDMQIAEAHRQHKIKMFEAQQRQLAMARQAQQQQQQQSQTQPPSGGQNGLPGQQRPHTSPAQQAQMQANGQQMPNMNGPTAATQQARPGMPVAPQRNGHLAPPQVNAQGIPQAQMQARTGMMQHPHMMQSQMSQGNSAGRSAHFQGQQYQMTNGGNMPSPGGAGLTNQQQLQQNSALLQAFHQQNQQHTGGGSNMNLNQSGIGQQMSNSPSMPPPPTPQGAPQQLSSGHVPQIIAIQNQLRVQNPGVSEEQLKVMATTQMKAQSQNSQARQNAMNAAAGIPNQSSPTGMQQQYGQNQTAYVGNRQATSGMNGTYMNGDGSSQHASMSTVGATIGSPSQQQAYAQKMWQRQQMQLQQMQMQSPNSSHAQLNGSPSLAQASPTMAPASPSMQYPNMNQANGMGTPMAATNNQRPSSRSNTPQMQRLGSSGSGVAAMGNGMQSPGAQLQGSPRNMQASMAR